MLREATAALSRLDASGLEELERRASALKDALAGGPLRGAGPADALELRARFRVFSDVVTTMGKDLAMLQRASLLAGNEEGVRWVR